MELEKLQSIIADVLDIDPEEAVIDASFMDDLNADSLDMAQIVMAIEDELDIEINPEDYEDIVTVGDALEKIKDYV